MRPRPYARKGVLWENLPSVFRQGRFDPGLECTDADDEPVVTQAYLDSEYEKDPISAAAEFGAEFRTDIEAYVTPRGRRSLRGLGRSRARPDAALTAMSP